MKNLPILFTFLTIGFCFMLFPQSPGFAHARLFTLDGAFISPGETLNDKTPTIIIFWKPNEHKCYKQIALMIDAREKTAEITDVNIVAICIDSDDLSSRIKPFVSGKDYGIYVYIDKNGDFK